MTVAAIESSNNASQCKAVQDTMAEIVTDLGRDPFVCVKPARWRDEQSDIEIETNYVYGEGTVRFYRGSSQTPYHVIKIRGRSGEINEYLYALMNPADLN